MAYLIYVVVKLACYSAWCWLGLRLWQPDAARPMRAAVFGFRRLAIGVVAGICIFFLVPAQSYNLLWKYIEIYAPVRLVEWSILALILRRKHTRGPATSLLWSVGGIVVSFAADLASPEGLAGRFCVGRCLC
jgi:hypothetical protein